MIQTLFQSSHWLERKENVDYFEFTNISEYVIIKLQAEYLDVS